MTLTLQEKIKLDRHIARLQAEGRAFALATVVRTVDATSAKPGGKALILDDGTIVEGWIGGGCARGAVSRAAMAALAEGQPKFVSLRPEELLSAEGLVPGDERDGVRFARNGCPSKGSMDIFVEPVLPQPRLTVLGAGPVALALADLSGRFDYFRTLAAPGLTDPPEVEVVQDSYLLDTDGRGFVVVATQGKGDEAALRAALATNADYIAFVGSRRKFATLATRLRADGLDPGRVTAPAGLDIHAITPDEIALSILAQITARRRAGKRGENADD